MTEDVVINCVALDTVGDSLKIFANIEAMIPYSQIKDSQRGSDERICQITIPRWLAKDRGLI